MVDSLKQSLPPKVIGPIHGYLDTKIDQIIWTRRANCAIKIKVHWWGQDHSEILFRLGKHKNEKTLYTYAIQTTFKLFRNYLMRCAGLTLSVIDEQMGTLIGTCVLNNLHLIIVDETPHEDLYAIKNEYDSQIGQLRVGFRLCFLTTSKSKLSTQSYESVPKVNSLVSQFDSSDDNIVSSKIVQKVLKQGERLRNAMIETILDNDPLNKDVYNPVLVPKLDIAGHKASAGDKTSRVFDYLTGANVSPLEEEQILNTIRTMSPTTSMIKLASDLHFQNDAPLQSGVKSVPVAAAAPSSIKICHDKLKSRSQSICNDHTLLSFVDSFKVYVYNLKLNSAGWRKILGTENKSALNHRVPTFFVEYVIPQLLTEDMSKINSRKTKVNSNITNQVTRFCSKKVFNEVIHFKQQSIHKIVNIDSLNLNHLLFELKIFSRNVSQRGASLVGVAKCNLSDVIDQQHFTCDEELVVIDTNKPLGIGTLKVRLQFGCDKLHFGKEFIEAITCEKENRKLSYSDSLTKELDHVEVAHAVDSRHKKPAATVVVAAQKEVAKKGPIFNEIMLKLLQCMIYIPEVQFETTADCATCTFLVCRAFWREDTTISKLCYHTQRAVYHFREVVPLLYDSEFLARTKNNYLVIEVWENDGCTENFVGICKLPLHQLYVAYRDPKVAYHLAEGKFPVIAFDGWEEIIHPITLNRPGQLQGLVAVGTESQIQFLEQSRGINAPSVGKPTTHHEFNPKHVPKTNSIATQAQTEAPAETQDQGVQIQEVVERQDKAIQTDCTQSTQTEMEDASKPTSDGSKSHLESFVEQLDQSTQVSMAVPQDTSKLLEVLQNVLMQPPEKSTFRAHIVIESAVHLAIRRRRIKSKGKHAKKHTEVMPTTYVSFEPIPELGLIFTSIVPKSTNPRWNQHFECAIPKDMLYDDQKRLIFKVWNKNGQDVTQPNVVSDSVIGFAALDLTVLPAGLPSIQGWFNILDFSSRCNGQIKINLTPLEDISKATPSDSDVVPPLTLSSPPGDEDIFQLTPSTSMLSNTLKRKFTELDEITERLKQRLMDVTKSDEDSDNNNEFEHDLNTVPPAVEDDVDDFDFTKLDVKLNCPPNTGVSAISIADSGFADSKDLEADIIERKMKENKMQFDALFEKLSLHSMQFNEANNTMLENITEESTESTDLLGNRRDDLGDRTGSSITLSSENSLLDAKMYERALNSDSELSGFELTSEAMLLNRETPEGAGKSTETLNQVAKKQK